MARTPDADYVARIARPGSIEAFALLFAGGQAGVLGSLLALRTELRESSLGAQDHSVAHARIGWWDGEIERLIAGEPAHPITRTLLAAAGDAAVDWSPLRGLIQAANIELARVVFEDEAGLDGYLQASGGSLHRVCAGLALGDAGAATGFGDPLGRALRRCEILDALHRDARRGFIAVPLAWLDDAGVDVTALQEGTGGEARRGVLLRHLLRAREEFQSALRAVGRIGRQRLTGQIALAAGYTHCLAAWQRAGLDPASEPPPVRPLGTLWTIWRAARRLEFDTA